ncbi:MAG: hypothetical protein JNL92_06700 [Opitutaceae bacterium]|nr:hypothetical protein [Opitutaceae bacterium]
MPCLSRARLGWLALLLVVGGVSAADRPTDEYARVAIAPTKTSIYIGTVAMTMPAFTRTAGTYSSTYDAKVFPFFFSSESGRLSVDISDALLHQLGRGEPIEFRGRAVNESGAERRIEGRATPADAASGKLKVRVFVSRRIELIFNTTYRFPDVNP